MTATSKSPSPWAKPLDAPSAPPAPPPRIPGLNYDDAVFPPEDDSDWTRNEGFVQGFAESVERRLRHGKPGPDRGAAFDMLMRHEAAEMERECHKFTGATVAQIQNPAFWRGLQPCRSALVDCGMFMLHFEHDGDDELMVSARFPDDLQCNGFSAVARTYDQLVDRISSELREWCRLNRPNLTV